MKQLSRNPFFYLSIALMFVVAFEVVNLVRAQYASPTQAPPGGQPFAPIDTSSVDQTKTGSFTTSKDLIMAGSNGSVSLSSTAGVPVLTFSSGNTFGKLWLTPADGKIMALSGGKTFEIGSGGGGGTNLWTTTADGILYGGGNVTVNNTGMVTKFWGTGRTLSKIEDSKQFAVINAAHAAGNPNFPKMPCDVSPSTIDCSDPYPYDPSTMSGFTVGSLYYDEYSVPKVGLNGEILPGPGTPTYKEFVLEARVNTGNTAVISVGRVNAEGDYYVKRGNGYSLAVPSGTWCGAFDGTALRWSCGGYNPGPPTRSCPPGWRDEKIGKGSTAGFANDWEVCVKN